MASNEQNTLRRAQALQRIEALAEKQGITFKGVSTSAKYDSLQNLTMTLENVADFVEELERLASQPKPTKLSKPNTKEG